MTAQEIVDNGYYPNPERRRIISACQFMANMGRGDWAFSVIFMAGDVLFTTEDDLVVIAQDKRGQWKIQ